MIDWSALVTALVAAAAGGGGAGAVLRARRPPQGSPEDHERRLLVLERGADECEEASADLAARIEKLEIRMQTTETTLAGAIGRLTESVDNTRRTSERLIDSVDELKGVVARIDVEATIERELRKHRRAATNPEQE